MTLEEAIQHLEETLADDKHEWSCDECKAEHEQLLSWLKELKVIKEAKGDLISREALKKRFKATHEAMFSLKRVKYLIDNAPTVEENFYAMGYQDGLEDGLDDIRPQGEWTYTIPDINSIGFWYCNQCNFIKDAWMKYRYCPNCGANMKGGAE